MNPTVRQHIFASARSLVAGGAHHLYFHAMGTRCRVSLVAPVSLARECQETVLSWIASFESRFSRFVPDSLINRIAAQAGQAWVETDSELDQLLALCHESHSLTRGIFDPTALPLVELWTRHDEVAAVPDEAAIARARQHVGWSKVQRDAGRVFLPEPGMSLDFGGIGREYAADAVAAMIHRAGGMSVLVDFGPDVVALGPPPDGQPAWRVGLEDPHHPGQCWGGVAVRDLAVASSGNRYGHGPGGVPRKNPILDVRAGRPVAHGARSVSVVAPRCTMAGVLATAAYVLGPAEGLRLLDTLPGIAGCVLTDTLTLQTHSFHDYLAA